ncbi:hypothetical protein PIB30_021665 [Stylosanthes scabra]|uniref:Uncharacterized protein n=1 Tax=Stylosanthes scabra TaxID=79078 RepID=A0ABU6ZAM3_9FABA|nr:hypothetical protein [Stylosanthes scabra]
MWMIPTPGSRAQSSETAGARTQTSTPTQTNTQTPTDDDEPPPPEPDPMPWPPAGRVYLRWDGGNCWNKVRKGTTKISWVFENYYKWFVPQFSMAPDHAVRFWWDRWRAFFRLQRGYE